MEITDLKRHFEEPLRREYRAAFRALRRTVIAFPYDQWVSGEKGRQPVRHACHLLFAAEGYLGGKRRRMGNRFGVRVESFKWKVDPAKCPAPKALLPWIDEVEQIADAHIGEAVRASFSGSPKKHPPLNRVVYVLRHTVTHLTLLRRELMDRGIRRPRY